MSQIRRSKINGDLKTYLGARDCRKLRHRDSIVYKHDYSCWCCAHSESCLVLVPTWPNHSATLARCCCGVELRIFFSKGIVFQKLTNVAGVVAHYHLFQKTTFKVYSAWEGIFSLFLLSRQMFASIMRGCLSPFHILHHVWCSPFNQCLRIS